MKAYLITFRSITLAQRGEAALQRAGIGCVLRRTPRWIEQRGCGYGVEARLSDPQEGIRLLQGIPYRRIYRLTDDGVEELR